MEQITVNVSEYELRRRREAFMLGALDAKRPTAWAQYGYPETVEFDRLYKAYERGGVGFGAVHRLLDYCWQDMPRIKLAGKDEETSEEKDLAERLEDMGFWPKFIDFDRRNLIGRYAGLIYRVKDSKPLREPLVGRHELVDIVPVFEAELKVSEWVSDRASPDYGKPAMFSYRQRQIDNGDTQGQPVEEVDVHPSRVQILAEGSANGNLFDGVPLLRAGFNELVNLEKITGGSAEGFLKNSSRTLQFKFDKDASLAAIKDTGSGGDATDAGKSVGELLAEKTDALNRNIDSSIVLQGGEASTLNTSVADPEKPFEVSANVFAASVRMPFTVLFGQQTGRLASDQDAKDMRHRAQSRRNLVLTPALREFIRRGQELGLIPEGKWKVEWPPVDAPGDTEKVERLLKMTQAAKTAAESGLTEPLFDGNEYRKVVGYDERTNDGMPEEGDPGADPNADPARQQRGSPAPATAPIRRAA